MESSACASFAVRLRRSYAATAEASGRAIAVPFFQASYSVSMARDAALGIETGDDFTVLTVGPKLVASRTISTGQSVSFSPYLALGLMFSNIDVGSNSSTDLSFPLHLGAGLKISPQLELNAELQVRIADSFNDDTGFSFGVNLPF